MSSWAIVAVVAIVASAVVRIFTGVGHRRRHGMASDGDMTAIAAPRDDAEKAMLRHEVEELRERIKVLERITTDAHSTQALNTKAISDEIEKLRSN
ncbi:MAG: hypothetical protein IE933_13205 [Sphingomonadales bacterium]|nr:hypothetical protein [Sphingomonadales bacterium]MBD3774124.1 hypothetical protein [Paracoccaceae bacterium]